MTERSNAFVNYVFIIIVPIADNSLSGNYYVITNILSELRLRVVFNLVDGEVTGDSPVRTVHLEPIEVPEAGIGRPTIAELTLVLGDPEMVRLASGVEVPTTVLIYQNQRVYLSVDNLECDKVFLSQVTRTIVLSAEPLLHIAWLSIPQKWLAYNYCYNFERVLS
jgi:hypothetical protein